MSNFTINYDQIATKYSQHRRIHPEVLKNLIETSGIDCEATVLEVGCGTGNYSLAISKLTGCTCWGIDPSTAMLALARSRSTAVNFQPGQAETLDFPAGYFDLVFSVDVIHHVRDRARYFQEAYQVLKLGGQICTVTDSEWIIRHRQPLSVYFPETVDLELKRYPAIARLRELMAAAGFNHIVETMVEWAYTLTDIRAYRDRAFSALHLISKTAFRCGLARMEQDLQKGPIQGLSRYVLVWGKTCEIGNQL